MACFACTGVLETEPSRGDRVCQNATTAIDPGQWVLLEPTYLLATNLPYPPRKIALPPKGMATGRQFFPSNWRPLSLFRRQSGRDVG